MNFTQKYDLIMATDLGHLEKSVLIFIARFSDDSGNSTPDFSSFKISTSQKAKVLKTLQTLGFIKRIRTVNDKGHRMPDRYSIDFQTLTSIIESKDNLTSIIESRPETLTSKIKVRPEQSLQEDFKDFEQENNELSTAKIESSLPSLSFLDLNLGTITSTNSSTTNNSSSNSSIGLANRSIYKENISKLVKSNLQKLLFEQVVEIYNLHKPDLWIKRRSPLNEKQKKAFLKKVKENNWSIEEAISCFEKALKYVNKDPHMGWWRSTRQDIEILFTKNWWQRWSDAYADQVDRKPVSFIAVEPSITDQVPTLSKAGLESVRKVLERKGIVRAQR